CEQECGEQERRDEHAAHGDSWRTVEPGTEMEAAEECWGEVGLRSDRPSGLARPAPSRSRAAQCSGAAGTRQSRGAVDLLLPCSWKTAPRSKGSPGPDAPPP